VVYMSGNCHAEAAVLTRRRALQQLEYLEMDLEDDALLLLASRQQVHWAHRRRITLHSRRNPIRMSI
jgi:hypothetical protein